jgi:hypothetical protein
VALRASFVEQRLAGTDIVGGFCLFLGSGLRGADRQRRGKGNYPEMAQCHTAPKNYWEFNWQAASLSRQEVVSRRHNRPQNESGGSDYPGRRLCKLL